MEHNDNALVSVCVICYNSSSTVLETLDSIKKQTYSNLELIISDDCSTDNTVEVCSKWLELNKQRFVNVTLISSNVNTGMSANYNRAINQAKGNWIKTIDGDDTLVDSCITDLIEFSKRDRFDIAFTRMHPFGEGADAGAVSCRNLSRIFAELTDKERLIILTRINYLPSPSSFLHKDIFKKIGFFDESIPFIEDWPFWIKASYNGCNIKYLDKVTVNYRIHSESVSQKRSTRISEIFMDSRIKAVKYACSIGGQLGLLEKLYYSIIALKVTHKAPIYKYVTIISFLNPFTYRFMSLRRKFNNLMGD